MILGNRLKKSSGITLIELLISMAMGLLIVGMMANAYISSNRTTRNLNQASLLTENGRYATAVLKDEIQLAGAFGFFDNQLGIVSTDPNLPNPCSVNLVSLSDGISVPIAGLNNVGESGFAAANSLSACLSATSDTIKTGTDVLITRRTHSNETTLATLDGDVFYVQTTPFEIVVADGSDSTEFNLTEKDGATLLAPHAYVQNIFYVSGVDDRLKKLSLLEDGYRTTAIADNVEHFQVEYGIDRSGNGAPNASDTLASTPDDTYIPAPNDGTADAITNIWQNVASVRALILLRSDTEESPTIDEKTFNLGSEKPVIGPYNDRFKRRLFYLSTRANNLSMRREN